MRNPGNVPAVKFVRHAGRDRSPASGDQVFRLRCLLVEEQIDAADLYGDGFTVLEDLSDYAASWGIEVLESRGDARWVEEQRMACVDAEERVLKANMGIILREKMRRG